VQAVKLVIYDILGREVAVPVNKQLDAGNYEVTWDASSASSGLYYYRDLTNKYVKTLKMILLK